MYVYIDVGSPSGYHVVPQWEMSGTRTVLVLAACKLAKIHTGQCQYTHVCISVVFYYIVWYFLHTIYHTIYETYQAGALECTDRLSVVDVV